MRKNIILGHWTLDIRQHDGMITQWMTRKNLLFSRLEKFSSGSGKNMNVKCGGCLMDLKLGAKLELDNNECYPFLSTLPCSVFKCK